MYNPAITLLGIYPRELKLISMQNLHTNIYSSLFIIAKSWKQQSCPSVSEWKNCGIAIQWNIIQCHTMEYYSVLKRSELLSHQDRGK